MTTLTQTIVTTEHDFLTIVVSVAITTTSSVVISPIVATATSVIVCRYLFCFGCEFRGRDEGMFNFSKLMASTMTYCVKGGVRTDHNCLLHGCHSPHRPSSRVHHLFYYNLHQTEIRNF